MTRGLLVAVGLVAAAIGAAPTAGADPYDQLRGQLPAGYGSDSCTPATRDLAPGALAGLDCRENSLSGGPTSAFYELFANPDALANQFQTDVSAKHPHPLPCPEGQPSPGSWHDDSSPNTAAGSVLCGSVEGGDDVAIWWTRDSGLLLALDHGPDLASMFDWWQANR